MGAVCVGLEVRSLEGFGVRPLGGKKLLEERHVLHPILVSALLRADWGGVGRRGEGVRETFKRLLWKCKWQSVLATVKGSRVLGFRIHEGVGINRVCCHVLGEYEEKEGVRNNSKLKKKTVWIPHAIIHLICWLCTRTMLVFFVNFFATAMSYKHFVFWSHVCLYQIKVGTSAEWRIPPAPPSPGEKYTGCGQRQVYSGERVKHSFVYLCYYFLIIVLCLIQTTIHLVLPHPVY